MSISKRDGEAADHGGRRRRRVWSADGKRRIVAETLAPGASVSVVARRHDVNTNMLFTWRREIEAEASPEADEAMAFVPATKRRPDRDSHPHGTFWYYNNWDFNALGTIYKQLVGGSVFDSVESRLAQPIGMEDFRSRDGENQLIRASQHPAYMMNMTARDLARFGWLYLNKGNWAGHRWCSTPGTCPAECRG
jgi:hypothetical protein